MPAICAQPEVHECRFFYQPQFMTPWITPTGSFALEAHMHAHVLQFFSYSAITLHQSICHPPKFPRTWTQFLWFFSVFQARFQRLSIGLPYVLCYRSHTTLREAGQDNDLTWYWIGKTLPPQEVPCNAGQVILLPGKQPTVIHRWFPACGLYVPVSGRHTTEVAIAWQHA